MTIRQMACRNVPAAQNRRRIVELAVQEWAFFGFAIVNQTEVEDDNGFPRRSRRPGDAQSMRVADSIAGYWTVTPGGDWIIGSQNRSGTGRMASRSRWRFPWSAAFVSWVMCEAGLRDSDQFQRAIAHHTYIDQAIRARDQGASRAAFVAAQRRRSGRRPWRLLCSREDRHTARSRIGAGRWERAREPTAISSSRWTRRRTNSRHRGKRARQGRPEDPAGGVRNSGGRVRRWAPARGARPVFAHLKLRAASGESDIFDISPTIKALSCAGPSAAAARHAASRIVSAAALRCTD